MKIFIDSGHLLSHVWIGWYVKKKADFSNHKVKSRLAAQEVEKMVFRKKS